MRTGEPHLGEPHLGEPHTGEAHTGEAHTGAERIRDPHTGGTAARRVHLGTAATVAGALVLAGCAGAAPASGPEADGRPADGDDLTPVTLQLSWVRQAQFAGYVVAEELGFYADEGLDVTLQEAGTTTVPVEVLARAGADYAVSPVPRALGSIEQGARVTNVAQVFERSGTVQVTAMGQGLDAPADLAGKKVGVWGDGNEWELFAGLQAAGVDVAHDVELVRQAADLTAFVAGDVDAAQATTYNEVAQLLETVNPATGDLYQPDELETIDWNHTGSAMLQDAIWADTTRLEDDPAYEDTTVAFLTASLKGWVYARDHPEHAAAVVAGSASASGSALGPSHQYWQTNEVNRLIWPSTRGIGVIDPGDWDDTVEAALTTRNPAGDTLLTEAPPASSFTNRYARVARANLAEEGLDVMGESFEPRMIEPTAGGG
ncbi:NitT/TauT family transport system substrate-binding protein [Promicromonospora sp. AC04]|uniref:ABC transporter substrate-binding protein n=1 Tax=Promicromonospora sp. AC04 TaxID=2135723 RepID=UPI000D3753CE|nr:ABC transporter substrate-binding protein [Promicromonospora sp. AC04]PUB31791.1 NitT/TauT family transport system substrate-binding protein [Promicromonospora sp. AC04]